MSKESYDTHNGVRPKAVVVFALVICLLGLGQMVCVGFIPVANVLAILLGGVLLAVGIVILSVKRFWRQDAVIVYWNFLTGAVFLLVAINSAFGWGLTAPTNKASPGIVWSQVFLGVAFFFMGVVWRQRSRYQQDG